MPARSDPAEASSENLSLWREFSLHLLVLVGFPALAVAIAAIWKYAYAAAILAVVGYAAVVFGSRSRHPKWMGWAGFLSVGISVFLANTMADASYVLGGKPLWDLPVQYAAEHPSVVLFTFRDGKVLTEQRQIYKITRGSGRKKRVATIVVAPLVREGAPLNQEITAWVVAEVGSREESQWSAPRHTGVRVRAGDWPHEGAQPAIAAAEAAYGLRTRPGAPLLRWRVNPQEQEESEVYSALRLAGLAIAGYLLLFWGWQGISRLRERLRS